VAARTHGVAAEGLAQVAAAATAAVEVADAAAAVAADDGERRDMKWNLELLRGLYAPLAVVLCVGMLAGAPAAQAQKVYPTPEAAADALVDGLARHDPAQIRAALGPDFRRYIPPGTSSDDDRTKFLEAWSRGHRIVGADSGKAMLEVGRNGWTLPIPIVKSGTGWKFDPGAAPDEMRIRRIGRNELAAMQVVLAYVDAQKEYAARDWDGDGVKSYAMRALSSPGKHDGLYWVSLPDEPESPLGPQFADARRGQPYHGYLYRILTAQGPSAPGGAKSYVRNGRMTGGFALVAWPAEYDDTGVMTFIVDQDGVVYEKDLGPDTATIAAAIKAFDPDATWQKAEPEMP
jgi:hypothetical protein